MGMRGGGDMGIGTNLKMIGEVKRENLGFGVDGKPEYYSTTGYISVIQKDKALYQACTQVNDGKPCNKKVLDQGNGTFRCEKCNIQMEDFNWRLILSMCMADSTDNQWMNCFQERAEQEEDTRAGECRNGTALGFRQIQVRLRIFCK